MQRVFAFASLLKKSKELYSRTFDMRWITNTVLATASWVPLGASMSTVEGKKMEEQEMTVKVEPNTQTCELGKKEVGHFAA